MDDSKVYIFMDNSNIFHGAQRACEIHEDQRRRADVRIDFEALISMAAAGREIAQASAVGSVPPGMAEVWNRLAGAGVEVELQERGQGSGKEQGVDQALRLKMMHALFDHPPAVCVLLTGDGGFYEEVRRMLANGWAVEVLSFGENLGKSLRQISTGHGGRGKYVDLDGWYEQLVFLTESDAGPQRGRDPLSLAGRPKI